MFSRCLLQVGPQEGVGKPHICVYIYLLIHVCVCRYVYLYAHISIHTYIHAQFTPPSWPWVVLLLHRLWARTNSSTPGLASGHGMAPSGSCRHWQRTNLGPGIHTRSPGCCPWALASQKAQMRSLHMPSSLLCFDLPRSHFCAWPLGGSWFPSTLQDPWCVRLTEDCRRVSELESRGIGFLA